MLIAVFHWVKINQFWIIGDWNSIEFIGCSSASQVLTNCVKSLLCLFIGCQCWPEWGQPYASCGCFLHTASKRRSHLFEGCGTQIHSLYSNTDIYSRIASLNLSFTLEINSGFDIAYRVCAGICIILIILDKLTYIVLLEDTFEIFGTGLRNMCWLHLSSELEIIFCLDISLKTRARNIK